MDKVLTNASAPLSGRRLGVLIFASFLVHLLIVLLWQFDLNSGFPGNKGNTLQVTLTSPPSEEIPSKQQTTSEATQVEKTSKETSITPAPNHNNIQKNLIAQPEPPVKKKTEPVHVVKSAEAPTPQIDTYTETAQALTEATNKEFNQDQAIPKASTTAKESLQSNTSKLLPINEVESMVVARLRADLNDHFNYPRIAQKRNWEGEVILLLEIAPDGSIAKISVDQSSHYTLLDNSAIETLARVGIIAEAKDWLSGRSLNVKLPVSYRLTSG